MHNTSKKPPKNPLFSIFRNFFNVRGPGLAWGYQVPFVYPFSFNLSYISNFCHAYFLSKWSAKIRQNRPFSDFGGLPFRYYCEFFKKNLRRRLGAHGAPFGQISSIFEKVISYGGLASEILVLLKLSLTARNRCSRPSKHA